MAVSIFMHKEVSPKLNISRNGSCRTFYEDVC